MKAEELTETKSLIGNCHDESPWARFASRDDASIINSLAQDVHRANKKWWEDLETGAPKDRNAGEMIALIHSELSEALEGTRKNLMDDKLPHRKMEEVEMADALIRLLDYCAGRKLDIGGAYVEKMRYNATRKDHTREERLKPNGKKI